MSQSVAIGINKFIKTNVDDLAHLAKLLENKKTVVEHSSGNLKKEVEALQHENVLLDKHISCIESHNLKLEKDINLIKNKAEENACKLEQTHWKIIKTEILKEFEIQKNDYEGRRSTVNKDLKNKHLATTILHTKMKRDLELGRYDFNLNNSNNNHDKLKEKVCKLKEEIDQKKQDIQMTDSKLYIDIDILKKRNAALLLRYQRQFQESESRLRQMQYELSSLKKLSMERDDLILKKTT